MAQQILQTPSDPIIRKADVRRHNTTTHINTTFLIRLCLAVAILLTTGGSGFLTTRMHTPLLLICTLATWVVLILLFMVTAKQRAIFFYLRETHNNPFIKPYAKLYISLESILDKYENDALVAEEDEALPEREVQDIVRDQKKHLMLLGSPGAGKTTILRVYQYKTYKRFLRVIMGREKIPLYIQMKDYNAFLMKDQQAALKKSEEPQHVSFLEYLTKHIHLNADTGFQPIHRYLPRLMNQGRLLLLCDGLNEVDSHHLPELCEELQQLMRNNTANRVVMTCREVDYNGQAMLRELVGSEYAEKERVQPLQSDKIREFITKYLQVGHDVDKYGTAWRYAVDDFMAVIERGQLKKYCTNPHVLITLMRTINGMTLDDGLELHTRGRLYQAYIYQFITTALQKERYENLPAVDSLIIFLSELACTGRRAGCRINISLLPKLPVNRGILRREYSPDEIADRLRRWLEDPQTVVEPLATLDELHLRPLHASYNLHEIKQYLKFAHGVGLIAISTSGDISFQHELVEEYLAAEYILRLDEENEAEFPFIDELVRDTGTWSQPIALLAGLLPDSLVLAKRLAEYASQLSSANLEEQLNALALSLTCVGVIWASPHVQPLPIKLPAIVLQMLSKSITNSQAREVLALTLRNCAEEGGSEVYQALLPLLSKPAAIEGTFGKLLVAIKDTSIVDIIFASLKETIDQPGYERHVEGAKKVLGQFREASLQHAIELSLPTGATKHLRMIAIEILGLTQVQGAVQPLLNLLGETDKEIYGIAMAALVILDPEFTFEPLRRVLQNTSAHPEMQGRALLIIKEVFAREDSQIRLSTTLYRQMIDVVVSVLSSQYPFQVHQFAKAILLSQAMPSGKEPDHPWMRVIVTLIRSLSTEDDKMAGNLMTVLQQTGSRATPLLLRQLKEGISATEQVRILEILGEVGDQEALPAFLQHMTHPSSKVEEVVAQTLTNTHYVQASIPELIHRVTSLQYDDATAATSARILRDTGEMCVTPVCKVLLRTPAQRVRLLVSVLVQIHHPEAIPTLIDLLKLSRNDVALATDVVLSLSDFQDKRVVIALIENLEYSSTFIRFYEITCKALSTLGDIAIDDLLAALDVIQETAVSRGAVIALAGMKPFPYDRLLIAFEHCSDAQAQQIMKVLLLKQIDTAPFLVHQLCHPHPRVREYVQKTVDRIDEPVLVPPLLNVLGNLKNCPAISHYLLLYPGCIPYLIQKLGDTSCNDAAREVLKRFAVKGTNILPQLIPALNEPKNTSQRYAQEILGFLAHHDAAWLPRIVRLFSSVADANMHPAREALLHVLTNGLAPIIQPVLLDELASSDTAIREGVSDALMHLAHEQAAQRDSLIGALIHALERVEYRDGAAIALIKIRELSVEPVSEFITDKTTGDSARYILTHIGAPAFRIIWSAYSNASDVERREAARSIFHDMPTHAIRGDLVNLLTSNKTRDFEMATTLLVERIYEDSVFPIDKQEMLPSLLEYILTNQNNESNQRILAFLLMLPKALIIDHVVRALYAYPNRSDWMIPAFLLIGMEGKEAKETLGKMLYGKLPPTLLSNVISVLGMMEAHQNVVERAASVGYSMQLEDRMIALRALGGLLAGGKWHHAMLETRRNNSKDGSIEHELFSLLLGKPYATRLAQAQKELLDEKKAHEADSRQNKENIARLEHNLRTKENENKRLETALDVANRAANKVAALQTKNSMLETSKKQLEESNERLVQHNTNLELEVQKMRPWYNAYHP